MEAMMLMKPSVPLVAERWPDLIPGVGQVRLRVEACGVCRTDLHIIDGELPHPKLPLIPGHEVVGIVDAVGEGISSSRLGQRVGIPWVGHTCGSCRYCRSGSENLCDSPELTGYTRDGGYASQAVADAEFTIDLDPDAEPSALAPLLCAGLIGWRSLKKAGNGKRIGLYGFGAAAHIIAQIGAWQSRKIYAFTRCGDHSAQQFALELGATWAGSSDEAPPCSLDAAIIFAPIGDIVPNALRAVRKGGRVICGGIHMSDIPAMPYSLLWEEREIQTVANLTRSDAGEFFAVARSAAVHTRVTSYPLGAANEALADLRSGRLKGAAVLVP